MPPKALKQILFKIESTAQFLEKIDPENKKLVGKLDILIKWYSWATERNQKWILNHESSRQAKY